MIEVPTALIPIIPYTYGKTEKADETFKNFIKNNTFIPKFKENGFSDIYSLSKNRIGTLFIYPVNEIRYGVKYIKGEVSIEPIKFQYNNKIIIIFNKKGYLEVIGVNNSNKVIIKNLLIQLEAQLGVKINKLSFVKGFIGKIINESEVIPKFSYKSGIQNGTYSKSYEYGSNLKEKLVKIDQTELVSFSGKMEIFKDIISYRIDLPSKRILLFNKIKKPFTWEIIFNFLDNIYRYDEEGV